MPSGSERDLHPLFLEEVPRPDDIVDIRDLVIDVLDPGSRAGNSGSEWCAVAMRSRAESVVSRPMWLKWVTPASGREKARARMVRLDHELDADAGRIVRGDEGLDAALLAFGVRAEMHRVAGTFEFGPDRVEVVGIFRVETDGLVGGVAPEMHQRVVVRVAANPHRVTAEIGCIAFPRAELLADDVGGEADRAVEVRRADADLADRLASEEPSRAIMAGGEPASRAVPPRVACHGPR